MIKVDENEVKEIIEYLARTGTYAQMAGVIAKMSRWLEPELKEVTKDVKGDNA